MKPVFRRIAWNGILTAIVLGIIGYFLAQLATMWLVASPGVRDATGDAIGATDQDGSLAKSIQYRIPLLMAVWGFAFVAVGELVLYLWRGEPKPKPSRLHQEPDEAEKLLEELLNQVESRAPANSESVPLPHQQLHEHPANPTPPPTPRES